VFEKADMVVITHANLIDNKQLEEIKNKIQQAAPKAVIAESYLEPLFFYRARKRMRVSVDRLQNQRVTTFAGIGRPGRSRPFSRA